MKILNPKIIYVGSSTSSFLRELNALFTEFKSSHPHELVPIDSFDLSLPKILALKPKTIILDLNLDNDRLDVFLKEFNLALYPRKILICGVATEINEKIRKRAIQLDVQMIFSKITGVSDEPRFLVESTLGYIYPNNPINRPFAVAKPGLHSKIQIPVWIKKITFAEILVHSSFKPHDKHLLSLKHDYLKKLAWREVNLPVIKTEPCHTSVHNYETVYKTEIIKQEELDRFESDVSIKMNDSSEDEKKEAYLKFLKPLAIEKKQNLMNFYRKNRFDCDKQNKKPILIISANLVDYKLRTEELTENYIVYKTDLLNSKLSLIKKFKPQVIFYEMDHILAEEPNEIFQKNNLETLSFLFFKLQEMNMKIPLVIFNNQIYTPGEISASLGFQDSYQEIQAPCSGNFIDAILKERLSQDKAKETKSQLSFSAPLPEPVLYPPEREYHQLGFAEIPAKIERLSEQEILIECYAELPEHFLMKVFHPACDFYFTILPNNKNYVGNMGSLRRYVAQISGINSEERDALRGYIITFNKNNSAA